MIKIFMISSRNYNDKVTEIYRLDRFSLDEFSLMQQQKRLKTLESFEKTKPIICDICYESKEIFETSCCLKKSCLNCEIENFKINQENVKCIQCGKRKSTNEIIDFLKTHNINDLDCFEKKTKDRNYINCLQCKEIMLRPSILQLNDIFITCNTKDCCKMCFFCGSKFSIDHNCLKLNLNGNFKQCPSCYNILEKTKGCDHMTCGTCGYDFCWICCGNYDIYHSVKKCHGENTKNETSIGGTRTSYLLNSNKFLLQSNSWSFLVNGITAIVNFYIRFIFTSNGSIDELLNICGNRYDILTPKSREMNLVFIIGFLNAFLSLFFGHCIVFSIINGCRENPSGHSQEQIHNYRNFIWNIISKNELSTILKQENGLVLSIINFAKSVKLPYLKSKDVEEWLKLNLLEKIQNFDKSNIYFPHILKYLSDFTPETNYLKTQAPTTKPPVPPFQKNESNIINSIK